jgi:hypothetical protein
MRVAGYKLNGYDATYEKTYFDVREGKNAEKNRVLEVTDINSGVTFIFEPKTDSGYVRQRRK